MLPSPYRGHKSRRSHGSERQPWMGARHPLSARAGEEGSCCGGHRRAGQPRNNRL